MKAQATESQQEKISNAYFNKHISPSASQGIRALSPIRNFCDFKSNRSDTTVQGKFEGLTNDKPSCITQKKNEAHFSTETAQQQRNKTGLPDQLKAGVERFSGLSVDDVKVHYNSSKPAQLNALAYAQGTDIHIGPGQERHLPHEAWHVVQQKQGRVKPTMQMKRVRINDDTHLESEADTMGKKMASFAESLLQEKNTAHFDTKVSTSNAHLFQKNQVVQCIKLKKSNKKFLQDSFIKKDYNIEVILSVFRENEEDSSKWGTVEELENEVKKRSEEFEQQKKLSQGVTPPPSYSNVVKSSTSGGASHIAEQASSSSFPGSGASASKIDRRSKEVDKIMQEINKWKQESHDGTDGTHLTLNQILEIEQKIELIETSGGSIKYAITYGMGTGPFSDRFQMKIIGYRPSKDKKTTFHISLSNSYKEELLKRNT